MLQNRTNTATGELMLDAYGTSPDVGTLFPQQRGGTGQTEHYQLARSAHDPAVPTAETGEDLKMMTLEEVRQIRNELAELERRISYWRRIIQARLDLLRDGSLKRGTTVEGLNRVLSQHLGRNNRMAMLTTDGDGDLPPLEGLARLWNSGISDVREDSDLLIEDLEVAERELSARRAQLHARIDAATAELVRRYREEPLLALTALPSRAARPSPL